MQLLFKNFIYESIDKPSENSNGSPISNSPEGVLNFWKWFGDSKTIDEKGRPIVFYHGSYNEFEEFQHPWDRDEESDNYSEEYNGGNLGVGFYFTKNKEYASRFGKPGEYYLKISNLYNLTDDDNIQELNDRFNEEKDELNYGKMGEVIDEIMNERKFDGVFAMGAGGLSYGADEWKVINAIQIKAVNNSGAFSNTAKFAGE